MVNNIADNGDEIAALDARVTALEGVDNPQAAILALQNDVTALQGETAALANVNADIAALQVDVAACNCGGGGTGTGRVLRKKRKKKLFEIFNLVWIILSVQIYYLLQTWAA